MNRRSSPLLPAWLETTLFCMGYLAIAFSALRYAQDPDLWWHLASGREMVLARHIPSVDVFSLTSAGSRWINSYWLYDLMVYVLFSGLGSPGFILPHVLLILGAFYFVDRRLREGGVHWILRLSALAVLLYGAAPSGGYWGPQASLVTLFLVSALLCQLERWRRDGWTQNLWSWIPLFLLWANLHRGFVIGLVISGFYVLNNKERTKKGRAWAWLFLCAGITLATPHPLGLYQMMWDDVSLSSERITGWMTPALGQMKVFDVSLSLFWIALVSRIKTQIRSWPLIVLGVLLTVESLRHLVYVSYFMIFAIPFIAAELSQWMDHKKIRSARGEGLCAFLLFGLFAMVIRVAQPTLELKTSPVFDFIRSERVSGPFYNDYLLGGQWIWAFGGTPPVFIDGRYPAVEGYKPLLQEITSAMSGPTAWSQFLDRYGIQAALVKYSWESPRPSVFEAVFPRAGWALVYWDDEVCLFVRRGKENKEVVERHQFLSVWPDAKRPYMIDSLRKMSTLERGRYGRELVRNAQLHPDSRHVQDMISVFLAHHLDH